MYHGIINVNKAAGFTSHDVVAKLRGICKQKKIGHTGTLDPDAVGVLPVCLGNGTRLCERLTDKSKEYVTVLRLGVVTDTQDLTGRVTAQKPVSVSPDEVKRAIYSFLGDYAQIPPMYSAIKIDGKKLYELARAGREVVREARPVRIDELEILSLELPEAAIRVVCSKGTYIRTLCHDIGARLGCGGTMAALKRTRSGDFAIEDSYSLAQLQQLSAQGRLAEVVIPVEAVLAALPSVTVTAQGFERLQNGNPLSVNLLAMPPALGPEEEVRVYSPAGLFYGIYVNRLNQKQLYPVKMFIPEP